MFHLADLRLLALEGVARRCQQETDLFFQGQKYDPRYCFELFCRAIIGRDQHAWQLVYAQYCPLVAGWVERHPAFPDSGEEAQYFVNRAFEKMWAAMTPDKFSHFSNLKSLLRYLQMCVHSVILDQIRVAERSAATIHTDRLGATGRTRGPVVEEQALAQVHRQEFWREIDARLRTDKERQVVYGSFILALKPREIHAQFRETFRDVHEVYRVKENVLARLRRDTELHEFIGGDT